VRPVLPAGQILRLRAHGAVSPGAAPAPPTPDWLCAAIGFDVAASAARGPRQRPTVRCLKQADDGTRQRIARRPVLIGIDQVGRHERAAADGSPGVLSQSRAALLIGDIGVRGIDFDVRALIHLCRVRYRTVDDGHHDHAGIAGWWVGETIADLEFNPPLRLRALRSGWSCDGRRGGHGGRGGGRRRVRAARITCRQQCQRGQAPNRGTPRIFQDPHRMLSIVPYPKRITVATLAAVFVAMCAACGSTTTGSAGPISPVSVDCGLQAPSPDGVGDVFAEIPGFTVTEICPADVDPAFASQEFDHLAAGLVSQNGNPMLRVIAGQRKSGDGDVFVHKYLENLSTKTRDGVGLPSDTEQLDGHVVTHFNIPLTAEGYAYADGPTVVIAYVAPGSPPATVDDALTEILGNLR
jgi:hypothetical protein